MMSSRKKFFIPLLVLVLLILVSAVSGFKFNVNSGACMYTENTVCSYASVNGLDMYYEIHGQTKGQPPLVLLHGQFATGGMFFNILPELVKRRQVIIIEQQGHGHTADIDRPLRSSHMAHDTAELLREIGVEQADIFGYSEGGSIALQLAVHHPEMVHSLVLASAVYDMDGYKPEIIDQVINPSVHFLPPIIRESYIRVAPDPNGLDKLVQKSAEMAEHPENLRSEQLEDMKVSSLVMIGDRDIIRHNHAEEMARLLGTELIVVSGDHASYIVNHPEELLSHLTSFLMKND
ncbi:alpha/beta fold hydrolase [Novibacillus thermophilus]|nr:alpha/beta hydrolase [Novibacillus thermophilus]